MNHLYYVIREVISTWHENKMRAMILMSLLLQLLLVLVAPMRKRTGFKIVRIIVWSTYMLAYIIAVYALGVISDATKTKRQTLNHDEDILVFWSSFLLLHLGGRDTITAFSLADNEFWLRQVVNLIFQAFTTAYLIFLATPPVWIMIPTILVFIAGVIKFSEKCVCFFLANKGGLRDSIGDNYAHLSTDRGSTDATTTQPDTGLNRMQIVQLAYELFNNNRADRVPDLKKLDDAQKRFRRLTAEEALNVIKHELAFLYDFMFTKAPVAHSKSGCILRLLTLCLLASVIGTLIMCPSSVLHRYNNVDIDVSYCLLFGALLLELSNIFRILFSSDWMIAKVADHHTSIRVELAQQQQSLIDVFFYKLITMMKPSLRRSNQRAVGRWSECVHGYSLVTYCCEELGRDIFNPKVGNCCSEMIRRIGNTFYQDHYNEIHYVDHNDLSPELWRFVYDELIKDHGSSHSSTENAITDETSEEYIKKFTYEEYVKKFTYHERVLLWHITTEVLYHIEKDKSGLDGTNTSSTSSPESPDESTRKYSKTLSDYMLYLVIMKPDIIAARGNIIKILFKTACDELMKEVAGQIELMKEVAGQTDKQLSLEQKKSSACTIFLDQYMTNNDPEGTSATSLLSHSLQLTRFLKDSDHRWSVISKFWVSSLLEAATRCRAKSHAEQLSKGGELISFVWRLLVHLGKA